MTGFSQMFGKRNPTNSAVRTQFQESNNGKRLEIKFLFSPEVVEITGWTPGELLDISRDGPILVIEPSKKGRTLHSKSAYVEFTFGKSQLSQAKEFLGFDVQANQFWERYSVEKRSLILRLSDINVPDLSS